jgi:hypothetical protein
MSAAVVASRSVPRAAASAVQAAYAAQLSLLSTLLEMMNLRADEVMAEFRVYEGVTVLGALPKQCYSFARSKAAAAEGGFYVEGYVLSPGVLLPIGHAWFEEADGRAADGTTVDARYTRIGVRVPVATFRARMTNPSFVRDFELHDQMPFARAAVRE